MIRPLAAAEAATAAAIIRAAFAPLAATLDPPPSAAGVTDETIRTHLQTGGGALHGAAGCVLWAPKAGGLYVGRLAVLPAWRRRGIAAALLTAAEAEARRLGLPRLHLEVRLGLAGNRRLFARAGFVETLQRAHPGYDRPTFVEAEKWLANADPPEPLTDL